MKRIEIRVAGRWIEIPAGSLAYGDVTRLAGIAETTVPSVVTWRRVASGGTKVEEGILSPGEVVRATKGMIFDVEEVGR